MEKTAILATVSHLALLLLPFFSGMVYDFFQTGMIFSKYGDWLFHEERLEQEMPRYKKPLGGCLKCFHVWVCIAWFCLFTDHNLIFFLLMLGVSYYILVRSYYQ